MVSVDLQVSSAASFILSSLIAQRLSNLGRRATDSCTTYTSCTINISPLIRGKVSAGTCQGTGGRGKRFLITHLLLGTYATSSRRLSAAFRLDLDGPDKRLSGPELVH